MLDYPSQSSNPSPIKNASTSGEPLSKMFTEKVPLVGSWFRHLSGDLYEVSSIAYSIKNDEPKILLKKLFDSEEKILEASLDEFFEKMKKGPVSQETFVALRTPRSDFYEKHVRDLFDKNQKAAVELYFKQPWRAYHSIELLYDFFEIIENKQVVLSPEQKIALILKNALHVPGNPHPEDLLKLELTRIKYSLFSKSNFNFDLVYRLMKAMVLKNKEEEGVRPLLDLENYNLCADLVDFLAYNERIWLENKGLLKDSASFESDGDVRKDYETRRLRYLMTTFSESPLFLDFLKDEESVAFENVEQLRKAWIQKYASKGG